MIELVNGRRSRMEKMTNETKTMVYGGVPVVEEHVWLADQAEVIAYRDARVAEGWLVAGMGLMVRENSPTTIHMHIEGLSAACRTLYRAHGQQCGSN